MSKIILFSEIVEENGKTIRENNLAKNHAYHIGDLIEFEDGERLFVHGQCRDCDGSPLYWCGLKDDNESDWVGPYGEHYKVVKAISEVNLQLEKFGQACPYVSWDWQPNEAV